MATSNPSHLLLNRHPSSPAHPQLASTLLVSRHAASPSLPSNVLSSWSHLPTDDDLASTSRPTRDVRHESDGLGQDTLSFKREEADLVIHPTFHRGAAIPGRVKVVVGSHEFWCHKEVLWFASPFFQGLLEANWAETNPPQSGSESTSRRASWTTTNDHSSPPPHNRQVNDDQTISQDDRVVEDDEDDDDSDLKASVYLDANEDGPSVAQILRDLRNLPDHPSQDTSASASLANRPREPSRTSTPGGLSPPIVTPRTRSSSQRRPSGVRSSFSSAIRVQAHSDRNNEVPGKILAEAIVVLQEESASAFQDFLFWCYPHLECKVTWTNVEDLLALSCKLLVPSLQKACEHFLMTHASGRPVVALYLAELHGNAELYREASRFVLDSTHLDTNELALLDEQTQLKLSHRRNWFLERLLKLSTIDVKLEYTCRANCPEPAKCQSRLDETWREAHKTVCRYGPPRPSIAYRHIRQLEPFPGPSLINSSYLCQRAAQSWVSSLFDRMFQRTVPFSLNPVTEKYWLAISID